MKEINLLFTCSGRRVSLINHFRKVLKELNLGGKIITVDNKKNVPTAFISDFHETAPLVTEEKYITFIKEVALKYNVNLIIPLIDSELRIFAVHKKEFKKMGITILVSDVELIDICNDKNNSYKFFKENNLKTPEIFDIDFLSRNKNFNFPYILKPVNGSASKGITKINNLKELKFFKDYISDSILQEFVVGEEYAIDVLVDFEGQVCSIVPRLCMEARAGEPSKNMTNKNYILINETKKLFNNLYGAVGCLSIDCFLTANNEVNFIEINPRFGGGSPVSIKAGADFPLWIIKMMLGEKLNIDIDDWIDGVVMLRYDTEIFTTKDMILPKDEVLIKGDSIG